VFGPLDDEEETTDEFFQQAAETYVVSVLEDELKV